MDLDLTATQCVLLAAVVVLLARWVARRVAIARFQRRTGSLAAPHIKPSAGLLGLRWMKENFAAAKTGEILNLFAERLRQSGHTYQVEVLGHAFHFTSDVDNIRSAVTNLADWGVSPRATSAGWAPFAQRGIFVSDGHEWEASRALVRPAVARGEISQLDKLEVHVAALVRRLEGAGGATVDLQKLLLDTTFDSALDFLLGVGTTGSLTAGEAADKTAFGAALDRCTEAIFFRMRTPPEWRWTMWRMNRQNRRDTATVHAFIEMMVARQVERLGAEKGRGRDGAEKGRGRDGAAAAAGGDDDGDGPGNRKPYIFADELLRATGGDAEQVKWELLSLLAAARDTTALLLSNVFHALARHPDVWARLKDEVEGLHGRKPDYEALKGMRYLKYVLNETLRVFPVVANNGRWANKDTTLPRGGGADGTAPLFAPKGTALLMAYHMVHRKTDVYGADADVFRPERWADPGLRPGWNFLPFSGGPRVCPGQQFALVEAGYTVVRLVQAFPRIENRDPRPYAPKIRISVSCQHGVLVGLRKA